MRTVCPAAPSSQQQQNEFSLTSRTAQTAASGKATHTPLQEQGGETKKSLIPPQLAHAWEPRKRAKHLLNIKRSKETLGAFAPAALETGMRTFGMGCTPRKALGLQHETGLLILPCPPQGLPGTATAAMHQVELSQPPKTVGRLSSGTASFFCLWPCFTLFVSSSSEEMLNCSTSGQWGKGRVSLSWCVER